MRRRLISLLLAMVLTIPISFGMSGMTAYAADGDVIEINNVDGLYNVRNNMSGNYKLMCDIDLTDVVATGGKYNYQGKGWEPFGATTQTEFTGTFDGNGHTILGLMIKGRINVQNGLFWINSGTIRNLSLKGTIETSSFDSASIDGLIAGTNNGTIEKCSVDGTLKGNVAPTSGLIVGINNGSIVRSVSKGSIKFYCSNGKIGGICGLAQSSATIAESVNNAYMDSDPGYELTGIVSGIVGSTDNSVTIENCYNTGKVEGKYYKRYSSSTPVILNANGIAGGAATVTNCYNVGKISSYYNVDKTYVADSSYACQQIGGGKENHCFYLGEGSLNDSQMTIEQSFEGFDFDNVWVIDSGADYKYPQLRNCRQDLGREIDMIELKSVPNKITYKTGDEFDPTGCIVTVLYKDNGSEDINVTTDMLSGYDMSTAGIQDVKFSYRGYSLSFKINVNQRPEITGMELTSQPLKTTFIRGTEFDFTGAVAQIKYKDGTTEDFLIEAKDCTGGDINTSGDYEITYTKFGHSVKFNVSVVPVREEGIHIESLPDKTSYIEGEDIDTTGLEVYVDYNSGASAPIEDYTIADYDNSAGTQTITVQYKDFEATFEVSFAEKNVLSIEVTKQPNKTEYVFGQKFDPTGMVVTANLDNGKTEEVTGYVVSPMEDRNGMQDLTVSYAGKTTYVTVLVTQRALDSISITTKPYKLTYIEGSEFDPEGMVVTAKYNDDTTEVVTDYSMTKLGKTPGNKTIVVSYNGKTTTLAVTVIAKTVVSLSVTAPNKVNYVKGEEFDPTGMVVTALYNDGTTAEVADYRVAGFGESDEVNILEVSYGGKSESIVVTIHEPGSWKITRVATCTTAGQETLACLECGEEIETREIPRTNHNMKKTAAKAATTEQEGNIEYWTCTSCGKHFADANGSKEITKEATVIPKKEKTEPGKTPATPSASDKQMGADGTATGAGASAAVAEKAITTMKSDTDPAGSAFGKLQLKSTKQTKSSVSLKWKKVGRATKYVVYGNKCGKTTKPQKLATSGKASYVVKKVAGKKLKKGTYYKFIVVALDRNNKVVSTSKLIHVATKGGKVGNYKSVNVDKSVVKKAKSLKKGKSLKLKAKAVAASKKLKVKKHAAVRYESSNPAIATVSKNGKIKARKAGKCNIYAYAQNGVAKTIKVVVK